MKQKESTLVGGSATEVLGGAVVGFIVSVEMVVFLLSLLLYAWGIREIPIVNSAIKNLKEWQLGLAAPSILVYVKIALPYLWVRWLPEKLWGWERIGPVRGAVYSGLVWVLLFGIGYVLSAAAIMNDRGLQLSTICVACISGQIVAVIGVWILDQRIESRIKA